MLAFGRWFCLSSQCPCLVMAAVLHEAIYCQGASSNWAAHAVRQEEPFATAFDAVAATQAGRPVYFTGEAVFPWMLEVRCSGRRPAPRAQPPTDVDMQWQRGKLPALG